MMTTVQAESAGAFLLPQPTNGVSLTPTGKKMATRLTLIVVAPILQRARTASAAGQTQIARQVRATSISHQDVSLAQHVARQD
jgi:hypothetical protein